MTGTENLVLSYSLPCPADYQVDGTSSGPAGVTAAARNMPASCRDAKSRAVCFNCGFDGTDIGGRQHALTGPYISNDSREFLARNSHLRFHWVGAILDDTADFRVQPGEPDGQARGESRVLL